LRLELCCGVKDDSLLKERILDRPRILPRVRYICLRSSRCVLTMVNDVRLFVGKNLIGFINPSVCLVFFLNLALCLIGPGFVSPTFRSTPRLSLRRSMDITQGSNPGYGTDDFTAAPGWDPVTGSCGCTYTQDARKCYGVRRVWYACTGGRFTLTISRSRSAAPYRKNLYNVFDMYVWRDIRKSILFTALPNSLTTANLCLPASLSGPRGF